jgi:hypothetical protein
LGGFSFIGIGSIFFVGEFTVQLPLAQAVPQGEQDVAHGEQVVAQGA